MNEGRHRCPIEFRPESTPSCSSQDFVYKPSRLLGTINGPTTTATPDFFLHYCRLTTFQLSYIFLKTRPLFFTCGHCILLSFLHICSFFRGVRVIPTIPNFMLSLSTH